MRKQRVRFLGLCSAMLLCSCLLASADTVYQTGFESPTYAAGTLSGQGGWAGSTITTVESTVVHSGAQAIGFNASQVTSAQSLIGTAVSYTYPGGQSIVTVQIDAYFTQSKSGSTVWDVMALASSNGFLAQLIVDTSGNAKL
jgi:hypothetical protein